MYMMFWIIHMINHIIVPVRINVKHVFELFQNTWFYHWFEFRINT